jgi:hypothetical protein
LLLVVIALPHHLISLAVVAPPCKNCGVTTAASAAPDITVTRLGLGFPYSWAILSKQTSRPTLPPYSRSDIKVTWFKTSDISKLFFNIMAGGVLVTISGIVLRVKETTI